MFVELSSAEYRATMVTPMRVADRAYYFFPGFAVSFLLDEPGFPAAGAAIFFAIDLVVFGFGRGFAPDFDAVEAFGFGTGFATFFEADTAGFVAGVDFPDGTAALVGATGFAGVTGLVGAAAVGFLPVSTFSGLGISFAAGGLFGFLFGGSCNSAKRSITSAMLCSVSA